MFSQRSDLERSPNALSRAIAAARSESRVLLDLTTSNPTLAGLPYEEDAIAAALAEAARLPYRPHPHGLGSARDAVAELAGCPSERVFLTASTSEAYAHLFKLLCDPGDAILVPHPSYPLFEMLIRAEGLRALPYRLAFDGEWHIDLPSLRERAHEAKAILVVSPNNPTGSFLRGDELEAMLDLGLPILCDEVFASYDLRPSKTPPLAPARGLLFRLGGLSKYAGLPQMKLGWVSAWGHDTKVIEAMERMEWLLDTFLSVSGPVQHALPALLESAASTRASTLERLRRNLMVLKRALPIDSPLSLLPVEGGWYAILRAPRVRSEERWCLELLERGVIVHPGFFYDFPNEAYLVLSLLTPPDEFAEGVKRLIAFAAENE